MKIIFYGEDAAAAKEAARASRAKKQSARVLHALVCAEAEECDDIEFLPDVSDFDRERLSALFGIETASRASEPADDGFKIGLGPRGRIYIRQKGRIHSGPFDTQEAAEAALAKERGQ